MPDEPGELSTLSLELHPGPFGDLTRSPYELVYGEREPEGGAIAAQGLEVRLGDRPLARNLRRLYELSHDELPPDRAVFDTYDLWIINHSVGVIRREGNAKVLDLGYQAEFDDKKLYTIDLLPQSRFVTKAEASGGIEVDLGAEGHARLPDQARVLLDSIAPFGADARLALSTDLKILGRLSFSSISPVVQAVGAGSSRCEWCISAAEQPLLGDQTLLQTVLVPRGTKSLRFRARIYATIKRRWIDFPPRVETDWVELECPLAEMT